MDDFVGYDTVVLRDEVLRADGWEYENKYDQFIYEQYDWHAPGFTPDYAVIRLGPANIQSKRPRSSLSLVYFTIVDIEDYERLTRGGTLGWYPKVDYAKDENGENTDRILRVGAYRSEVRKKTRFTIHLPQRITEVPIGLIDHANGLALDNRQKNLRDTSYAFNVSNRNSCRKSHPELLPGVEWRDALKTKVGGVVQVTIKGVTLKHRSPEVWPLSEQLCAQKWRDQKRKEIYGHNLWVNSEDTPDLPVFPPLKRSAVSSEDFDLQATF